MIWIRLHKNNATRAVVYTSDKVLAEQLNMKKKKRGAFFYKSIPAKYIRKALGFIPKSRTRSSYMEMIHSYPEAAAYILRKEKIPLDIKARMEQEMEWNPVTKDFNREK